MLSEAKSLSTPFERNTVKQISILTTDKSEDTNRTRIEYILLLAINIGSKDLAIISARLGNNIIVCANQVSHPIDRRGQSDQDFPFGSHKSGNGMSVDFGRNTNEKIGINPLRTPEAQGHRLPVPGSRDVAYFTWSAGRQISPTGDFRVMAQQKVKIKTLEKTNISKMLSVKIILKLKKLGTKIL